MGEAVEVGEAGEAQRSTAMLVCHCVGINFGGQGRY
jgi:hypothetical protein